jgi:signal peptidase I
MAIAEQNHFVTERVRDHDTAIMLGYLILSIIFLAAIYSASMSPGIAPGDFASMVAFP